MQSEPMGQLAFNFVVKHAFELDAFKNLFVHSFLPACTKSSQQYQRELKFSKYKDLIKVTESEFRENYFETIRLGYVGAFHKYESYIKSICEFMDEFFKPLFTNSEYQKIDLYLKNHFKIELRKTINNFYASEKINWIANCVKHYDGYPIKEPIHWWFTHNDKSKKIEIESKEFKEDLESLATQNQLILTALFLVGFHQYINSNYEKVKQDLSEGKTEEDIVIHTKAVEDIIISTFKKNIA